MKDVPISQNKKENSFCDVTKKESQRIRLKSKHLKQEENKNNTF